VVDPFSTETGDDDMFSDYAALYNDVSSFDNPDHVKLSKDYFQTSFMNTRIDLEEDIVLVRTSKGELIASGIIFQQDTSPPSSRIIVQVHPDYRCQGIGSRVLQQLIESGKKQGANLFTCRIPSYRSYAISFVKNRGFDIDYTWIKMHLKLEVPAEPITLHWGFRVRGLNIRKELHIWAQLQNEIFEDDPNYTPIDVETLKTWTKRMPFDPNLTLVGIFNDTPVGICAGWPVISAEGEKKVQIRGMGIVKKYRRKGYGQAMLFELLNRAYLKGYSSTELVVRNTNDAALSLYESSGFTEMYKHCWFKKRC
jgi:ribosomal protein S18 acetylase RimI-like enzyme